MARLTSPPRLDPRWRQAIDDHVIALGWAAWVEHVVWGPKGDYLVSAAGKWLRLWAPDGSAAKSYPDAASTVADVAWSPRGKEFVAAGFGGVTFYRPDADGPVNRYEWK